MAHETVEAQGTPIVRFGSFPRRVGLVVLALVLLGAAAFGAALLTDMDRAWRAYAFNWLFWVGVAQGAVMLAVAVVIARGRWAGTVQRIALSFVAYLPIAFLLFIPLLLVGGHLFPWIEEPVHGKEFWLNMPGLAGRNLLLLGALLGLSLLFAYWALRPEAERMGGTGVGRGGFWGRLGRKWQGQDAEELRATSRLAVVGPILGLVYALAFTILAFDFVMSLEPHWFSTLLGGYFFMGAFLSGIVATTILTLAYRASFGLAAHILVPQIHDLGKLVFAFCVFWAYLFWSQFLVIWYGLLPWEQEFVVHRFAAPYAPIALLVFLFIFVFPFFGLLGRTPKTTPAILGLFAAIVLAGLWLERYLLTYPSYYPGAETLPLGWQEVGTACLFAGLFIAAIVYFAVRVPILQVWERRVRPEGAYSEGSGAAIVEEL